MWVFLNNFFWPRVKIITVLANGMLNTLMHVQLHMQDVKLAANQEGLTLFHQH